MTIQAGHTLQHYRLVEKIGEGGMGEVWLARDVRLERDVAVKILPAGFATNEQFRARFEREGKTISSLNHPNPLVRTRFSENQPELSPDGQRFLLNLPTESRTSFNFHAIFNWTALLEE